MALENFVLWSAKGLTLGRILGNRMKQMSFERVSSTVIATRTKRSWGKSVCVHARGRVLSFFVLLSQRQKQISSGRFSERILHQKSFYVISVMNNLRINNINFKWYILKWTLNQFSTDDIYESFLIKYVSIYLEYYQNSLKNQFFRSIQTLCVIRSNLRYYYINSLLPAMAGAKWSAKFNLKKEIYLTASIKFYV